MDFGVNEKVEKVQQFLAGQNASMIILVGLAILIFTFLPAILAAFLNRKNFKTIFFACIPAVFSTVAWFALVVWAATGKLTERKKPEESE